MKKITVITFLLVICLAFSGCDSKNTNHDNEETTAEPLDLSNYSLNNSNNTYDIASLFTGNNETLQLCSFADDDSIIYCTLNNNKTKLSLHTLSLTDGTVEDTASWDYSCPSSNSDFSNISLVDLNPIVLKDPSSNRWYIYKEGTASTYTTPSDDIRYYVYGNHSLYSINDSTHNIEVTNMDTGITKVAISNDRYSNYEFTGLIDVLPQNNYLVFEAINTLFLNTEILVADIDSGDIILSLNNYSSIYETKDKQYVQSYDGSKILSSMYSGNNFDNETSCELNYEFSPAYFGYYDNYIYAISRYTDDNKFYLRRWDMNTGKCVSYQEIDLTGQQDYIYNMATSQFNISRDGSRLILPLYAGEKLNNVILFDFNNMPGSSETITISNDKHSDLGITELRDYGNLTKKAAKLKEKYGFNILWGSNAPTDFDDYSVEPMDDNDIIYEAISEIEQVLSKYPDNFFDIYTTKGNYRAMNIYLCGTIHPTADTSIDNASAFTNRKNNCLILVIDATSGSLIQTMYHELAHTIYEVITECEYQDSKTYFDEDYWCDTFNPPGFDYYNAYINSDGEGYDIAGDASNCGSYFYEDINSVYFVDSYAKTYITEDLARLMEYDMIDPYAGTYDYMKSDKIQAKLNYFYSCIRSVWDTSGWPSKTSWEE